MSCVLKINGKEQNFPEDQMPKNLLELLGSLGINEATVVAEIDEKIVERKDFAETELKAGQSIELVRFVGGG